MKKRFRIGSLALSLAIICGSFIPTIAQADDKVETTNMEVKRLAGSDRYDTAVKASEETFKKGSKYVVIASGDDYIDALVGGSLTSQENAPLLLVSKNSISKSVKDEIKRLKPEEIFILGGDNTISKNVEKEIVSLGFKTERLAGKDRKMTAQKISGKRFKLYAPESLASGDLDAVIDGNNFADALAAGPFVGEMTRSFLGYYHMGLYMKGDPVSGIDIVFGGTSSVPQGPIEQYRFAGADRYGTAVEVAIAYKDILKKDIDTIVLVDGTKYPDALASASVASKNNGAVLLTSPKTLPKVTKDYIVENKNIKNIIIVGGENSVSSDIEKELKALKVEVPVKESEEEKPTTPTTNTTETATDNSTNKNEGKNENK